ncbi:unnamed protein product [Choristocarpus tenellus]
MVPGGAPWYSTRPLSEVSLGSLMVLCVLRCIVNTLTRARDDYLLKNLLAILLNLAPEAQRLHPYTTQRLVTLLGATSRRWATGMERVAGAAAMGQIAGNGSVLDPATMAPSTSSLFPSGKDRQVGGVVISGRHAAVAGGGGENGDAGVGTGGELTVAEVSLPCKG